MPNDDVLVEIDMRQLARRVTQTAIAACLTCQFTLACSGGGSAVGNNAAVAQATTASCAGITGASALYWDFSTGVLRTDYPPASTFPPVPAGGSFLHPRLSLTIIYPAGWSATALIDNTTVTNEPARVIQGNLTVLAGTSVLRSDGRALWRYLHTSEANATTAQQRLNEEVQRVLNGFGIAGQPTELCSLSGAGSIGGFPGAQSATLLRAGEFTIQVISMQAQVPLIGQSNALVTVTSVAPTTEYDARVLDSFLPIGWQLIGTQCSDRIDNDGDGAIDLSDQQCSGLTDNSESS